MAPKHEESSKRVMNRGAWTADEDKKLSQCIEIHGPRRWKTLAFKSGLKRCGKSCRLRWLNYLRPNVKRGNITEAEEDLILRLHKLLGNRWSLIAGRLPGRTDNEIKNYWNSHLSKKINNQLQQKTPQPSIMLPPAPPQETAPPLPKVGDVNTALAAEEKGSKETTGNNFDFNFDMNQLFDFSAEGNSYGLEWVNKFLELDDHDTWDISSQKIRKKLLVLVETQSDEDVMNIS